MPPQWCMTGNEQVYNARLAVTLAGNGRAPRTAILSEIETDRAAAAAAQSLAGVKGESLVASVDLEQFFKIYEMFVALKSYLVTVKASICRLIEVL